MKNTPSPRAPPVSRRPSRMMTACLYSYRCNVSSSLYLCHCPHLHNCDHTEEGEGEGGHDQHQGEDGDEEGTDAQPLFAGWNKGLHCSR